jgi:hypothetical protein
VWPHMCMSDCSKVTDDEEENKLLFFYGTIDKRLQVHR